MLHIVNIFFCYLQSLKSRAYVTEQFAWRHYYWYLTNEGIQYLRDYLHLPPEVNTCASPKQVSIWLNVQFIFRLSQLL